MDTLISELTIGDLLGFVIGLLFGSYMVVDGHRHVRNWIWWIKQKWSK